VEYPHELHFQLPQCSSELNRMDNLNCHMRLWRCLKGKGSVIATSALGFSNKVADKEDKTIYPIIFDLRYLYKLNAPSSQ
jgi:hypothetical protein